MTEIAAGVAGRSDAPVTSGTRILHLEDSAVDAELVAEYLRSTAIPFTLHRVTTREEFVAALEAGDYHLILADYALPSFDGVQALAIARQRVPATPFIFVSGVLGEDNAVECLKQGATDYVLKQRLRKLPMAVTRALAEARERQERERVERALQSSYRALRDSEERLRILMGATGSIMWTADAVGRFRDHQPGFEHLTGAPFAAYRGWNWLGFVHPADRDRMRAAWREAAVGKSLLELEHRVRMGDGEYRTMLTRGVPILGPEEDGEPGRLLSWVGTTADIDTRTRAEQALQRLNETLERRVIERTAELAELNRQLLRQIEERARAEEALRHAQKMEAVGQLTGGVAHDFNNLLTVVMGGLDIIQRQVARPEGPSPERIRSAAENAMQGARRAATLTQRLLAFSRRQSLDPKPIDANRLVSGMSDMLRRTLGEKVALRLDLAPDLCVTEADPNQLENAVINLAVNARDAMESGGRLVISTANRELAEAEGGSSPYVMIAVADTGSGMDAVTIERAFEPFFTTKDVGHGTGLGLSQVYGFVRQSRGHVRIDSTQGEGTTVRIYLPRRNPATSVADAAPAHAATPPRADGHHGLRASGHDELRAAGRDELRAAGHDELRAAGATVLVVEDDAAVRAHSTRSMRELGYAVVEAADGAAALDQLDRNPDVGLLFTDVGLPGGMNGRELAAAALRRRPGLRVLFTSGYALAAFPAAEAPQHLLLAKPFTAADLAAKLREVLSR